MEIVKDFMSVGSARPLKRLKVAASEPFAYAWVAFLLLTRRALSCYQFAYEMLVAYP